MNTHNRLTNYGVVRLELLEHIYETMYMQRVTQPDEERWQHRILNSSNIVAVDTNSNSGLRLQIERNGHLAAHDFDAVVLATGYARDAYEDFLAPARYLMPGGDVPNKQWEVERDYRVVFEKDAVSPDAGVFLQGCCEGTHGVSAFSHLANSILTTSVARRFAPEHSRHSRRRDCGVCLWQQIHTKRQTRQVRFYHRRTQFCGQATVQNVANE